MKRFGILGVFAVLALAAAGCGAGRAQSVSSRSAAGQIVSLTATKGSIPAWAQKCLPRGSRRLGTATRYIGLTRAAAGRLDHHRNSLVFAGGGGRCAGFQDQVFRTHPIAVVYNVWNVHRPEARIIAAVRAAPGWQPRG
jgi:hypothetical protein